MNQDPIIGIDLGTSTTVVCQYVDGKPLALEDPKTKTCLLPSVVSLSRLGKIRVGADAENDPNAIRESKRDMGADKTYSLGERTLRPQDVAAEVLRTAVSNAELVLGVRPKAAVVTVPAHFGDLQRRATSEAIGLASLNEVRLINEPTAAALAYGLDHPDAEGVFLVFDWGGGTLDVTVVDMIEGVVDVKTSHGDGQLGGKDVDAAIVDWAEQAFRREHAGVTIGDASAHRLKLACKSAKESLSSTKAAEIVVENFAASPTTGEELTLALELNRLTFDDLLQPFLSRAMGVVDVALAKGSLNSGEIERVLPVGGSCWMPAVREALARRFPDADVVRVPNPDLAIAQGAAISAASAAVGRGTLAIAAPAVTTQDVCNMRLGIDIVGVLDGVRTLVFEELIAANTPIPYFRRESYKLQTPEQTELEMQLFEDHSGRAIFPSDAIPTSVQGVLTNIPHAPTAEPHRIEIEFRYDASQYVEITARVLGTNKELTLRQDRRMMQAFAGIDESSSEQEDFAATWESSSLAGRNRPIIQRGEAALEGHPRSEQLEAAIHDLKLAVARNQEDYVRLARGRIIDLLAGV